MACLPLRARGRKSPPPSTASSTPPLIPSRSGGGSPATPTATSPSPPVPLAPTSSTSTSTAQPAADSPPCRDCGPPGCSTAPPPRSAPPAAAPTSTSPAPASATATWPRATSTSAHKADTSSSRRPWSAGRHYQHVKALGGRGTLDWQAAAWLLEPSREHHHSPSSSAPGEQVGALAHWLATQREGNRNAGLFWAANRALETDPAADLSQLAAAARQLGLDEPEITRTLNSARRTTQARPQPPDRQAEGTR